ncbi:gluconokinase [Dyadobacter psychrotolerans]|uniref:Carbohydrate kinase n=1 Tax=Dyadobacter psychrotolerans TaxID=2541721 RepID=A0A4R5E2J4_9BACT|nr:gluconokinase [Dyadobacter psychrotolerans]TDE18605.1 carbohydrate kinase [Dyadobacter psychrotolerans]
MPYIIGCDIGTTNVKSVAFDSASGEILHAHSEGYEMQHPETDWSEQDPEEIFQAACKTIKKVAAKLKNKNELLGISFSAAMHGVLALDKSGKHLTGLIIWADNRSSFIAEKLKSSVVGKKIYHNNGTPIHAMTPVCKLIWLKEHEPEVYKKTYKFIGIKEYIIYRLTGNFVVDYSIASATGMFNIRELKWDEYTLKKLGLKSSKLSEAVSPYHIEKLPQKNILGLPADTSLIMGASDGCLANLGSGAIESGSMAVTIGTSAAVRISSDKPFSDKLMQTFCYVLDEQTFVIGGPSNNGAVVFEWLMNTFFPKKEFDEVFEEASKIKPGADGLLFYPYLLGERAPLWSSTVRGGFSGLDIQHTLPHFARAVMEGILLNLYSIGKVLLKMQEIKTIYANGGFARSPIWVQMLSDIFGKKVKLNETVETGAIGAAMMGLKALGVYKEFSEMKSFTSVGQQFSPDSNNHEGYHTLSEKFIKGARLMLAHAV